MVATGVKLLFIAQLVFVNAVVCPDAQSKMFPNRQRLGFTFKRTDLSSTGGRYVESLRCE